MGELRKNGEKRPHREKRRRRRQSAIHRGKLACYRRVARTFKRQYVSCVCMSEVVSSTREVRKDKGNVGRLALLVAPIRDRI